MSYKFEFTLDDSDYLEFNKFHAKTSPSQRRSWLWMRFGVGLVGPGVVWFLASNSENTNSLWVVSAVFIALYLPYVLLFDRIILEPTLKRILKNAKKEGKLSYSQKTVIRFDAEQIHQTSDSGEGTTPYHIIERIGKGKTALYIFIGAMQAIILPYHVFESEAQKQEFIEFIKRQRKTHNDS